MIDREDGKIIYGTDNCQGHFTVLSYRQVEVNRVLARAGFVFNGSTIVIK